MTITQLQQTIEANLSQNRPMLDGIALKSENLARFLAALPAEHQYTAQNTSFAQLTPPALRLNHTHASSWALEGIAAGTLQDATTSLTLAEGAASSAAQLEISGSLQIPALNQAFPIRGSMPDPLGSMMDFEVPLENMPDFSALAQTAGLGELSAALNEMGVELPAVTGARFGYNLSTQSCTYLGVDGAFRLGGKPFNLSCLFAPELIMFGRMQAGTQLRLRDFLSAMSFDPEPFPDTEISALNVVLHPATKRQVLTLTLTGDWNLPVGGSTLTLTQVEVELELAPGEKQAGIQGKIKIGETTLFVAAKFSSTGGWQFTGGTVAGVKIELRRLLETLLANSVTLPAELPNLACSDITVSFAPRGGDLALSAKSDSAWELPIGINGLSVGNLNLSVSRAANAQGQKTVSGTIGGTIKLGAASFAVNYNFPGDFVLAGRIPSFKLSPLVQDLCGGEALRGTPIPSSLLEAELTNIAVSIAPQQKTFSLAATSVLGQSELQIKRQPGGNWGFSFGFIPPPSWALSKLDPALSVLDKLKFSNTALIVASSDDRSFALATVKSPRQDVTLQRGVNLFATLDMAGLGVDQLLGVKSLVVYAAIGNNPRELTLEARFDSEFPIAENVTFGNITFRLRPSPTDFAVTLLGDVNAKLGDSQLRFTGGLGIRAIAAPPSFQANLQATMQGVWNEPFGARGIAVANVGLDLGIAFPPLRPSLGIAGALQIGEFKGAAAVKFDTANPGKSMVAIAFNRLTLMDVFKTFCPPAIAAAIPQEIAKTVLDVGFENVNIHIVPQPTSIGELRFEQGISLQGTMIFWGLRAFGRLNIDQTRGILVEGDVDEINLGGVFKLTGAGGKPKASLRLDLGIGQKPRIDISGAVELLGIRSETQLSVSDRGFFFVTTAKLFNLFEATLEVQGGNLKTGDGIFIKATMKNDLFKFLREEASKAIQQAADEATRKISQAQQSVTNAQQEVNRLNGVIEATRRTIRAERERDAQRLRDAQQAVQNEQNEVNQLNNQIEEQRRIVQAERERDAARLRDAQQAIQNAQNNVNGLDGRIAEQRGIVQAERNRDAGRLREARQQVQNALNEVNRLQGEIDSTKRRIDQLNGDIAAKQNWFNNLSWWNQAWAWVELSGYAAAKTAEIGALYTKIGGIEAAKHTAFGVLELARISLRGMEQAAVSFPIDADVRVAGLIGARTTAFGLLEGARQTVRLLEQAAVSFPINADVRVAGLIAAQATAIGLLEAARQTLRGMELAAVTIPIDADPRIVGLFAALGTATGGVQAANLVLEGVKQSVRGAAEAAQFIVKNGLGGLLDIRQAEFSAGLSAAHGGRVSLGLKLMFMNQPQDLAFSFNFKDPLSSAKDLAKQLLPA